MPTVSLQVAPGGPLIDIMVGVSQSRAQTLQAAGQPVPNAVPVRGLVDTGASCTCIDPSVFQTLGLTPRGVTQMLTPSTGQQFHQAPTYDVSLILTHPAISLTFPNVSVAESHLSIQGIQALIGRDILNSCLLVYDGQRGIFILAF
jgi:hypothetical protein